MKQRKYRGCPQVTSAEKAKGTGLNFKTSSDLSMMLVFIGLLLGGKLTASAQRLLWGDVSTPVPGNHSSAIFQDKGSIDSGSKAFWRGPRVSELEIGSTPARLQQNGWLSGNGRQLLLAWVSSDDRHLDFGRLILLSKPQTPAGVLNRWQIVSQYRHGWLSLLPWCQRKAGCQTVMWGPSSEDCANWHWRAMWTRVATECSKLRGGKNDTSKTGTMWPP